MTRTRSIFAAATPLILAALAAPAAAQPASAQAEVLYNQGRQLMEQGKVAEACAALEASEKAGPATTTLFAAGVCREKNGQYATAWGEYVELQRQTRTSSDPADQQLAQLAGAKAAALEPKLSKLTVVVAGDHAIAGLEVRRAGDLVDAGAWNQPLPVDGGTYKITAHAPGHEDWSTTVTVKPASDAQTVTVPALAVAASPEPGAGADAPRSKKLPILFGGGALVLGAVAVGFELWAEHYNNEAQASGSLDEWHAANWRRYTAEGVGIAAVASAGTAIFLYVRHGQESPAQQAARRFELVPVASAQVAGLQLDGHF